MCQNDWKTTISCKRAEQLFWLAKECPSSVEKLSSGIQFLYQFLQLAQGVSTGGYIILMQEPHYPEPPCVLYPWVNLSKEELFLEWAFAFWWLR